MAEGQVDYAALKRGGFMRQRQKNYFSLRLRVIGGRITAEQLPKLAEVAGKYGKGYIHLTTRQGIEIPFVHLDNVEEIKAELAKVGLEPGVCGPRVRTLIACQGDILCPHGWINAEEIAVKLDEIYYGKELPHKFKFSVTACVNNCAKPQENDLGIMGVVKPVWEGAECTQCGLCQAVCPQASIELTADGIQFDLSKCILCGDCIKSCPGECWRVGEIGHTIFVGGRIGRRPELGWKLAELVSVEELYPLIDRVVGFYIAHGRRGERFGVTLHRKGYDIFRQEVLGNGQTDSPQD